MSTVKHLLVDRDALRLDQFLAHTLPERSRSFWQKQCQQGFVLVDDQPASANVVIHEGQRITITLMDEPDFTQQSLPVIYEDDDVLVIEKPAGVLTHAKGALSEEFSVAEFVRSRTTDGVDTNRPGIVHRLDRGTSGLLIAAKHTPAKQWLQKQFSERKVKKTYVALIEGHLKPAEALLRLPIERNPQKPQQFRVGGNGKSAETAYKVQRSFKQYDLVELYPLTGRTHQLRVHLAYLHRPIVGDTLYGAAPTKLPRFFLHAARLELTLPSRERKVFASALPQELQSYLNSQAI